MKRPKLGEWIAATVGESLSYHAFRRVQVIKRKRCDWTGNGRMGHGGLVERINFVTEERRFR
jgi:hypothetical protein